jgi:hypothetical protein
MKERFGYVAESKPISTIENGDRIGVSAESFSSYTKDLGKPKLRLIVNEWHAPHGNIPPTTDVYLMRRGESVELCAMHPEELTEDQVRWVFGEAVPKAAGGVEPTKALKALDKIVLARRREIVLKEIQTSLKDDGIRYMCEQAVKRSLAGEKVSGSDLLQSIAAAMGDGSDEALREMHRTIGRFNAEWQSLSIQEQDRLRKEMVHASA